MGKKIRTTRPGAGKKGKNSQLTPSDLAITGGFVGSIILCLVAFSNAVHPLNDTFILWPALIGGVAGLLFGLLLQRLVGFESAVFVALVMAASGALLAIGLVLALNRPLDRSVPDHHVVKVVNKFDRGGSRNQKYFLEVQGFVLKRLEVEDLVYNGCAQGGRVDILTRRGFFGFPYLDRVQLISLDLPTSEKLPDVMPAIPLPGTPLK